ncbi:hypothetical protein ACFCVY_16900 [Streptomyces sp. NPDC056411]|uniref:hypothetical protein n=1 Tax=Streptomyces sp. NPDC056411 TaxID=3345813 RepID=UPI0035E23781
MPSTTRRTRRSRTAMGAALAGVAVLGMFATAQAADAATASQRTAQAVHSTSVARAGSTPYVINHYGEENADRGRAERNPAHLVLSEFTSINAVDWKKWDAKRAVGTGEVTGSWCLETCMDKPLKATVTLSDPRTVDGRKVYTSFTLKLAGGAGQYDAEDLHGTRPLATN